MLTILLVHFSEKTFIEASGHRGPFFGLIFSREQLMAKRLMSL